MSENGRDDRPAKTRATGTYVGTETIDVGAQEENAARFA